MSLWLALLVGAGGAIGSLLRYGIGRLVIARQKPSFYGTLIVNLAGSFAIGIFIGLNWEHQYQAVYAFTVIGLLGGLTTYSTLNVQKATMVNNESRHVLAGYMAATYLGGWSLTAIGVGLGYLLYT
ncbi:CrcB family protein [Cohnella sp.]|uniref:fluoride efflux transporter FluC n=1 Tax=Cohnella sp. TaxID=1883426 RepID=UPI003561356F